MLRLIANDTADSPTRRQPCRRRPPWCRWHAPPAALVLPGGWQIEGLPDIDPERRAGGRGADGRVFHRPDPEPAYTRAAYAAAVTRFFTWCDARGLELAQISPVAVATYIEEMQGR